MHLSESSSTSAVEVFLRKLEKHIVSVLRRWYNGNGSICDESTENITEAVKLA